MVVLPLFFSRKCNGMASHLSNVNVKGESQKMLSQMEVLGSWGEKKEKKNESQEYLSLTRNMSRKMAVSRKLRVEESVGDLPSFLTDHDCHLILIHKSSFKLTSKPSSELSHENGHKSSHLQLLSLYSSSGRSGLALKCRPFRQNSSL